MRLAMVIFKYFPYGGLQRDMSRMAAAALRRGHAVTVFASSWAGPVPEGCEMRLLPVRALTNHGALRKFAAQVAREVHGFAAVLMFNRIPGGDFYFAADNCLAVETAKKHSRLVVALHPRYQVFLRQEREVFCPGSPTRIFYIASRQKEDYMRVYGTPAERFIYLPPGIDPAFRDMRAMAALRARKRMELGLSDTDLMLVTVGFHKDGERVIRALAALPAAVRDHCHCYLVGGANPHAQAVLASRLGVWERVLFTGGRDDIAELLAAADLMVHPARNEATGTVLLEAIASGLPVMCGAECGFCDFVRQATGLVAAEGAPQAAFDALLADALSRLPELRERTVKYAQTADFYRRADVAIDAIEAFARARDGACGAPLPAN